MRTFVAISIPPEGPARRFLKECRRRLKLAGGDARWTRPEQWHITLRFIGETSEEQAPALREAVQRVAREFKPFEVRLEGWGAFPEHGAPRVIWAGANSTEWIVKGYAVPALACLHGSMDREIQTAGVPLRPETFHPHVTLARLKPSRDIGPLPSILRTSPPPGAAFTATSITLFESALSPQGSVYTPLLEATLEK